MHRRALCLIAALVMAGCRPATDDINRAVIVLVLDGVRTQESFGDGPSDAAGTEHPSALLPETWARLMPYAVRATTALNIGATVTAPAHAAILTGRRQPFGNYELEDEDPGDYRPELPSLMEVLRGRRGLAKDRVALIANTILVKPIAQSLWPLDGAAHGADFEIVYDEDVVPDVPARDDVTVLRALKARIQRTHPQFILANLHQADRAGHYGDRPAYASAVADMDEELSGFWDWIQDQPAYADKTWLIVTADHGRHTESENDPPWKMHGDGCWGCRNVPLLVLGPGVRVGQDVETPILSSDLGVTIAALLDLDLPWAEGRVASELFQAPLERTGGPEGVAEVAAAGGRVGIVRYLDTAAQRKRVEVDGVVLSDPDAIAAEALSMAADAERTWLCFRELVVVLGGRSEWRGRCFVSEGAGWRDIGGPEPSVGPFWQATLLPDGGGLDLIYPYNPYGIASFGTGDSAVGVRAARYQGGEWTVSIKRASISFPGPVSALRDASGIQLVLSAGDGGMEARHDRVVWSATVQEDAALDWGPLRIADLRASFEGELPRLEYPVISEGSDGLLRVAALADTEDRTQVVIAARGGEGWVTEAVLDPPEGHVMPHLAPRWYGDRVIFPVVLDARGSAVCAGTSQADLVCVEAGPQRIQDMAIDGDTLRLVADTGSGDWSLVALAMDAL